ncbi:MAG: VWA domain-containing protein [bacterium]|nr:VWA domain-containing protein [bacterium]
MSEFRFAQPDWLYASWLVLLITLVLIALDFRGHSLLDRFVSSKMQQRLVRKTSRLRRLSAIAIFALVLLALVAALMRPQWGRTLQSVAKVDSQVMICLDVSKSMLAEDVVPNRLERAKAEIDSLLGLMDEGQQVGLIAFAGKATVASPMTTDFGFLRLVLGEVSPSSVGLGGTKIGEAIRKAVDGFRDVGDVNRLILLITDGEDHDSFPLDAAEQAREKGIKIVSIGFGDEVGSKIEVTDPNTGVRSFVKDGAGQEVVSRLDGAALREIALTTEGAYIPAGTGALDLQSIYDAHIESLLSGTQAEEQLIIRNEGYQWFVLLALVLLMLWFAVSTPLSPRRLSKPLTLCLVGLLSLSLHAFGLAVPVRAQTSTGDFTAKASSVSDNQSSRADESVAPSAEASEAGAVETEAKLEDSELPPRTLYNQALAFIQSEPDRAERLLNEARNRSSVDGELRYRSLYNLGWVDVARADELLEAQPEEALKHLELAASRFREAIRIRPASDDARHNLEVLSRRIVALRDALARQDERSLEQRLDEVISALREQLSELQAMTNLAAAKDNELAEYRSQFRSLSLTQQRLLGQVQELSQSAAQELERLAKQAEAGEQSPQERQLRQAQLRSLAVYLDRGIQRMTKARSYTRRSQPDRAFLRWSAALSDCKRARDQLRNPIEVLSVLIAEARETVSLTDQMLAGPPAEFDGQGLDSLLSSDRPAWLSADYLVESQQAIHERVSELRSLLELSSQQPAGVVPDSEYQQAPPDIEAAVDTNQEFMLESVRLALPYLKKAEDEFQAAVNDLQQQAYADGQQHQLSGIQRLMDAAEYFYDLRRLIEVMYADENIVQSIGIQLEDPAQQDAEPQMIPSLLDQALEIQSKNYARLSRLGQLLDREAEQLMSAEASPASAQQADADADAASSEQQAAQQRLAIARQLSQQLSLDMRQVIDAYQQLIRLPIPKADLPAEVSSATDDQPPGRETQGEAPPEKSTQEKSTEIKSSKDKPEEPAAAEDSDLQTSPNAKPADSTADGEQVESKLTSESASGGTKDPQQSESSWKIPSQDVDRVLENLEQLRRLYFTLIEHLRETAQRQAELTDDTLRLSGTVAGMESTQLVQETGALQNRQNSIRQTTEQLADALQETGEQQQQQAQVGDDSQPSDSSPASGQPGGDAFLQAAQLVEQAEAEMQQAIQAFKRAVQLSQASPPSSSADSKLVPDAAEAATEDAIDPPDSQSEINSVQPEPEPAEKRTDTQIAQQAAEENPALEEASQAEQQALIKLLQALQLLDDPQQDQNQNQQDNQQQDSQQQQQDSQPQDAEQQPSQNMNAAQMLQAIRDREAQRRDEKKRAAAVSGGVEKDW